MSATSSTLVTGFDCVTLPVRDIEAASAFYGETLGLRRSVYAPERSYSEFETGNLTLSVIDPAGMGLDLEPSRNPVALHVDDVAAARSELEGRGVEFFGET